jgi:hypothetical protein
VLFTDEFEEWWLRLSEEEQDSVDRVVRMLAARGVTLPYPYTSGVATLADAGAKDSARRTAVPGPLRL